VSSGIVYSGLSHEFKQKLLQCSAVIHRVMI